MRKILETLGKAKSMFDDSKPADGMYYELGSGSAPKLFNVSRLADELKFELTDERREELVTFFKRCSPLLKIQSMRSVAALKLSLSQRNVVRVLLTVWSVQACVAFFCIPSEDTEATRERLFKDCCRSIDVSHQALIALAKRP